MDLEATPLISAESWEISGVSPFGSTLLLTQLLLILAKEHWRHVLSLGRDIVRCRRFCLLFCLRKMGLSENRMACDERIREKADTIRELWHPL